MGSSVERWLSWSEEHFHPSLLPPQPSTSTSYIADTMFMFAVPGVSNSQSKQNTGILSIIIHFILLSLNWRKPEKRIEKTVMELHYEQVQQQGQRSRIRRRG